MPDDNYTMNANKSEAMPRFFAFFVLLLGRWACFCLNYLVCLIKLDNGKMLVLEIKGQDSAQNRAKRLALANWCKAVNDLGEYGEWCSDVAFDTAEVEGILRKYLKEEE